MKRSTIDVTIDLSPKALEFIAREIGRRLTTPFPPDDGFECEVDNFRNMLLNLLERYNEPETGNLDLIGG